MKLQKKPLPVIWQTSRFQIDLSRPRVMGIVNVTPDSFSDGGRYFTKGGSFAAALAHCEQLIKDGADLLDIGGESTRPGAGRVAPAQEQSRIIPVIAELARQGLRVSVDTLNSTTAAAAAAGVCTRSKRSR